MRSFGLYGGFPRRFGGGTNRHRIEHEALLDALDPAYARFNLDRTPTAHWVETYGMALGPAIIWATNENVGNQMVPTRMTDMLPVWEQACEIPPAPYDTLVTRRGHVQAKFRGFANNAFPDLTAACQALAGAAFVGMLLAAAPYVWWAGGSPGPPGREWSSARAIMGCALNTTATPQLMEQIALLMIAMAPAWMTCCVGIWLGDALGPGIVADVGVCDLQLVDV